jgi:hypothetical protein
MWVLEFIRHQDLKHYQGCRFDVGSARENSAYRSSGISDLLIEIQAHTPAFP